MAGSFADPAKPYWMAHGILMILAWGFFIPVGTSIAVYRRYVGKSILKKETSFYPMHRNFQTIGFLFTFLAFGLAAAGSKKVYGTGKPFDPLLIDYTNEAIAWNHHVKWGVSVLIIVSTQVLLGIWHHTWKAKHDSNKDAKPWKRPWVPSWLHVVLGVVCMLVAYITMYQGLQIYNFIFYKTYIKSGIMAGYVFVSLSGFLFLVSYAIGKLGNLKSGATGAKKKVVKEEKEDEMEIVVKDESMVKEEAALDPEEGSSDLLQCTPALTGATPKGSEHFA